MREDGKRYREIADHFDFKLAMCLQQLEGKTAMMTMNAEGKQISLFDPVADIETFHEKFKLEYSGKPRQLDTDLAEFRIKFLKEELEEYQESSEKLRAILKVGYPTFTHDYLANTATWELEKQLDALVDLVYVALGTAYLQGFDFREAWRRVHAANMAKVRAERKEDSKRGSTFDVVKPEGWTPPSHKDLVQDHAHKR